MALWFNLRLGLGLNFFNGIRYRCSKIVLDDFLDLRYLDRSDNKHPPQLAVVKAEAIFVLNGHWQTQLQLV